MPIRIREDAARLVRFGREALPASALIGCVALVLYWRVLRCGLISDAWELLAIANLGLPEALFAELGYHVIPVTHLISTILWKTFRLWEPGYQIVNIAELVLSAVLVYFLGGRLFGRKLVGLLAALLLIANSSFYEVTCWPVIGNFQIAAGLLQLGGLFAVHRAVRSSRPALWSALFGLAAVLAFFTYEPAVSLLPAGVLYAALVPPEGGDRSWRQMWRRAAPLMIAAVVAFLPMLVAKIHAASIGNTALFLPESLVEVRTRLHFIIRACISIFTLRGAETATNIVFFPRGAPAIGSTSHHVLMVVWFAGMGLVTLLGLFKSRRPAVPFLLLWFWIHIAVVSVATVIVSRQYYLAAIPASLLLAWAIFRLSDAVVARAGHAPATVSPALAFIVFAVLAAGAKSDLDDAAKLHRDSTLAARRIRELIAPRIGSLDEVALLNLPAKIVHNGMGAYAFVNGTRPMVKLGLKGAFPSDRVNMYTTLTGVMPGPFANGTSPISLSELERMVADPRRLVLWFDPRSRSIVELNSTTWPVRDQYTADSVPLLPWEEGVPPLIRVRAGEPLELPLHANGRDAWVALRFAHGDPALSFEVVEGSVPLLQVRPQKIRLPGWPSLTFPMSVGPGEKVLTIRSDTEISIAGLWTFYPPVRYSPATTPFLSWWMTQEPVLVVAEPIRFPLSTERCPRPGCTVSFHVMVAPGGSALFSLEGGAKTELIPAADDTGSWRTVTLDAGLLKGDSPVVLRVEPTGSTSVLLRWIEAGPAPDVLAVASEPK